MTTRPPAISTSQLLERGLHSFSITSRLTSPSELKKVPEKLTGAPSSSGRENRKGGMLRIRIGTGHARRVTPQRTSVGASSRPRANASLEKPWRVQNGSPIASATCCFVMKRLVTFAWHCGHSSAIRAGSCSVAKANGGSTCSYSTRAAPHTTHPNPQFLRTARLIPAGISLERPCRLVSAIAPPVPLL